MKRFVNTTCIANIVIYVFGIIAVLTIAVIFLPQIAVVKGLENRVKEVSDIFAFGSMLFSAIAFIIAALAYKAAIQRPKLTLEFDPWMGNSKNLALPVLDLPNAVGIWYKVGLGINKTRWKVWLRNQGVVTARYPVIELIFKGMTFGMDSFPGWKVGRHAHGLGWYSLIWAPGSDIVVHPGFPVELPTLEFSNKPAVRVGDHITIYVIIAADGFYDGPIEHRVTLLKNGMDSTKYGPIPPGRPNPFTP